MNKNLIFIDWPNERLEPVLITYNRAKYLERTLNYFYNAGLTSMKLHILDNNSTDNTREIVMQYQNKWPFLKYHKNKYNIGGNANILRAIEIVDSEYSWVIGDDDEWYLDDLNELMEQLKKGDADIIRLGWLVSERSKGKMLFATDLTASEKMFFASVSMISATIVKRDLFKRYLPEAYMNTGDAYPQLVPFIRGYEEGPLKVYSLKKDIMLHTPSSEPGYYVGLEWFAGWFRTGRFFNNEKNCEQFINEVMYYTIFMNYKKVNFLGQIRLFDNILTNALRVKALGFPQAKHLLSMIAYGKGWRIHLFFVIILYSMAPKWLLTPIMKILRSLLHRPDIETARKKILSGRYNRL
ncbi:MAG TPA: glycosyltransferase family 2 protein [Syntrophorhabdaceae bacterium]|nr:glycosyltransferase family 2 protein [Syntrophorhabdaceae bacterium]